MTNLDPFALEIPAFLDRRHELKKRPPAPATTIAAPVVPALPDRQRRLTKANRDRFAQAIISAILKGADTFGKLRAACPDLSDREIRSGIRRAATPQLVYFKGKTQKTCIASSGKRYSVEIR